MQYPGLTDKRGRILIFNTVFASVDADFYPFCSARGEVDAQRSLIRVYR